MEAITQYKAVDGSIWNRQSLAMARDIQYVVVREIMQKLEPTPVNDCNWEGYVQQSPAVIKFVKRKLFQLVNVKGVLKEWIDRQIVNHGKTEEAMALESHPSWFARMLDDCSSPLGRAYNRLCRIDGECREWNQPFYANNTPDNPQPTTST